MDGYKEREVTAEAFLQQTYLKNKNIQLLISLKLSYLVISHLHMVIL